MPCCSGVTPSENELLDLAMFGDDVRRGEFVEEDVPDDMRTFCDAAPRISSSATTDGCAPAATSKSAPRELAPAKTEVKQEPDGLRPFQLLLGRARTLTIELSSDAEQSPPKKVARMGGGPCE